MKQALDFAPTFTPGTRQLDFSGYSGFTIRRLLAVINTDRNAVIYAAGLSSLGASSVSGSVVTLVFDTTSHNAADRLVVLYDEVNLGAAADAAASSDTGSFSVLAFIKRGMQNWTLLLARIPALVSGRVPVDASGVTVTVSGPLTDTQLRASPVPVTGSFSTTNSANGATGAAVPTDATQVGGRDGSGNLRALSVSTSGVVDVAVSNFPATQAISAAALPLPSGAATSALQTTGNTTLSTINGKFGTLGQKNMAGSAPVVIASDQSAVPVSGPLTDTQLRAAAVPVSGPLTDTQLRASAVPVTSSVPAALTVKQQAITVGTSAVRITTDALAPSATRRRLQFMADPSSTASFWFGSSTVTNSGANRGIPVFPGAAVDLENDSNDYYIIASTASQTVHVVEVE